MTTADDVEIHPTATVCAEATLIGKVSIKAGSIIHPNAVVRATNGPIVIGENNMIEENVLIENANDDGTALVIGNDNIFEVGSVIRASSVGSGNIFGILCQIGSGVVVGNSSSIGVRCTVMKIGRLPSQIAMYGEDNESRTLPQQLPPNNSLLDVMRRILPSYHQRKRAQGQSTIAPTA